MSLKEFLKSFSEDDNEKILQKITDSILDFLIIKTPKAIAKSTLETYSWIKDGIVLAKNSIVEAYKKNYDTKTLARLLQKKENGQKFCENDYKAGEIVCKYSKFFYNKILMKYFCEKPNKHPNAAVIIKKNNSRFHKGYCACSLKKP
ncbi:MAG: hypothetical protein QW625_03005 [Candidatus Nanoarchaeia archaeon]